MRYQDAFSSPYISATDVQGREFTLTIREIKTVKFRFGKKPVICFDSRGKNMLVLNRTNAEEIAKLYGDEMDNWKGKRIAVYQTMVSFGDKMRPGVRVKAPRLERVA